MEEKHYYTDERNAQIVIALLKAHGIKRVIANPGTTNIAIVGSVQNDPWFEVYSGVDERHSAYMAVGMAAATGEPVVLSCTGATASRNYLPALTEAYYRKLPVLALTSMQGFESVGQLAPQALDRTRLPKDAAVRSFECRAVRSDREAQICERQINEAILELKRHGGGPVHVNLEISFCLTFGTQTLPSVTKIERYESKDIAAVPPLPKDGKIALFVGSGAVDVAAWSDFAKKHNVAVFADCGSSYRGSGRIDAALLCSQAGFRENPKYAALKPDLILCVGQVSGDYPVLRYLSGLAPVWRVSPTGEVQSRFGRLAAVFEMSDRQFVEAYAGPENASDAPYFQMWSAASAALQTKIPELPFSNAWIAQQTSGRVPSGAIVHLGILNSLRSWDIFPPKDDVATFSNVGGFGIDGTLSTTIGSSLVYPDKLHFCACGDLAFFYDLNALGNRYVGKNLRILLVNNGCGAEFDLYDHPGSQFGAQTNDFIAAGRHFGNQSKKLVKHYAEDLGFAYLSAINKDEFNANIAKFVVSEVKQSMVFECFTEPPNESDAHRLINQIEVYAGEPTLKRKIGGMLPSGVKQAIKGLMK